MVFCLIIQVLHAFCWGDETETKPLCVYSQPPKGSLFFLPVGSIYKKIYKKRKTVCGRFFSSAFHIYTP